MIGATQQVERSCKQKDDKCHVPWACQLHLNACSLSWELICCHPRVRHPLNRCLPCPANRQINLLFVLFCESIKSASRSRTILYRYHIFLVFSKRTAQNSAPFLLERTFFFEVHTEVTFIFWLSSMSSSVTTTSAFASEMRSTIGFLSVASLINGSCAAQTTTFFGKPVPAHPVYSTTHEKVTHYCGNLKDTHVLSDADGHTLTCSNSVAVARSSGFFTKHRFTKALNSADLQPHIVVQKIG